MLSSLAPGCCWGCCRCLHNRATEQSLEEDDVVAAAAAPAVVAMGTAAAACLDEADVGRQGSRGETPEAR